MTSLLSKQVSRGLASAVALPRSVNASLLSKARLATLATADLANDKRVFLEDHPVEEHNALPMFTLSKAQGFLPRQDPTTDLPPAFGLLEDLLQNMTIVQPGDVDDAHGSGLLAKGQLGDAIHAALTDGPEATARAEKLLSDVRAVINTPRNDPKRILTLNALFRDFCFLTSAYLLEPVDQSYRATGLYAQGRGVLPWSIAKPMCELANELGHFPYMEYSSSYALSNYRFKDAGKPTPAQIAAAIGTPRKFGDQFKFKTGPGRYAFDNMELIRSFENAQGSEKGFILVHVEMLAFSGRLVNATETILAAVANGDVHAAESGMMDLLATFEEIQESMETMWTRSSPSDYLKFRSFIYGTLGKPNQKFNGMFPNGVVYEGIGEGGADKEMNFRGESGANDSIIPMADNLLEITKQLPDNELTRTLRDFRTYRPKNQREYLAYLESRASFHSVREFCTSTSGSPLLKALYILMVDQVRAFRNRHWNFTKSYIIERTDFALATGGSPIIKYLPNNLATTLRVLEDSYDQWTAQDEQSLLEHQLLVSSSNAPVAAQLIEKVQEAGKRAAAQRRMLEREVLQLTVEKDAKNVGVDESVRGMATVDPALAASPVAKTMQARSYSTNAHSENKALKRGMVGCDGVG